MNRKEYQAKISAVNVRYNELKVKFEKQKVDVKYLEELNRIRRTHLEFLNSQLADDLNKLNLDGKIVLH
jgi:hypothetical protein